MHRSLPRLTPLTWVFALALTAIACAADPVPVPRTFTADGKQLADVKRRVLAGDKQFDGPLKALLKDADASLEAKNYSVLDKPVAPASGDMHDYMTLAPYWWPDPTKPDGLPYIRKDGEVNPEREKFNLAPFENATKNVNALALAYYFTGEEKYAEKAAAQIRVWFFDDATRMNPNLRYAQIVRGREAQLKSSGVLESDRLRRVLDADGLLAGSKHWSDQDHQKLSAWMKQYIDWIQTSEMGQEEARQPNNHGSWYCAQTATFALYLDDEATAKKWVEQGKAKIASQIEPDGSQPHELARTKAWDYSRYNILAHVQTANIGERVGIDVWNYKTDDGRSLRGAIDWLIPYSTGKKEWTYQQIEKPKLADMFMILRRAAIVYNVPAYEAEAANVPGADPENNRFNLLFPKPKF
ncbi:hypothetical protein BH09PLA1_BH09PLA1_04650 [soil metagenome]